MSSSEISKNLGANRITTSKYLDILYFQKIINKKKIGSVNFWFLDPGITNLNIQDEKLMEVQQELIHSLINSQKEFSENIILSLINYNTNLRKIFTDVCLPVLNTLLELYRRGKIGKTEKIHLLTNLSDSIRILKNVVKSNKPKLGNSLLLIVSGDDESLPICIMIDILSKWQGLPSTIIGNVENSIDPFFDVDFQRYINKTSKKIKGKTAISIISNSETSIRFLYSTLNTSSDSKEKIQIFIFSNKDIKEKLEKFIPCPIYTELEIFMNAIEHSMLN